MKKGDIFVLRPGENIPVDGIIIDGNMVSDASATKAPIAIMVGNGMGAKNGILFKTAVSLEEMGKAKIVALAYALEKKSEHPLARAIIDKAEEEGAVANEVQEFKVLLGNGISAKYDGKAIYGGSYRFISEQIGVSDEIKEKAEIISEEGKTPLFFTHNGELCGIIVVADTLKNDSQRSIKELQNMGIYVVMLTGDNEKTANAIGIKAGADVVLMKNRMAYVPAAIRLSRGVLRNIHENLFWAFIYNIIRIPLAAGVFISILGWKLNPMFAAATMSLSSFSVVTNALRLNLLKIYDSKRDYKVRNSIKNEEVNEIDTKAEKILIDDEETMIMEENKIMDKTIIIEGMMCGHCEMHVKKALEVIDGVEKVEVSHEKGTAIVTLKKDVVDEVLKEAIVDEGYEVKDIQ